MSTGVLRLNVSPIAGFLDALRGNRRPVIATPSHDRPSETRQILPGGPSRVLERNRSLEAPFPDGSLDLMAGAIRASPIAAQAAPRARAAIENIL